MKYLQFAILLAVAALLALSSPMRPASAQAHDHEIFLNQSDLKWGPAPPGLPPGGKIAVLFGDPHASGPYVVRLMAPAGYTIPPHWHSKAENLTILSGTLNFGTGDRLDRSKAHPLQEGGYHFLPAKAHHFAVADVPTVVQIHGEGPFDITYVNPADDPRNQKR